LRGDGSRGAGW